MRTDLRTHLATDAFFDIQLERYHIFQVSQFQYFLLKKQCDNPTDNAGRKTYDLPRQGNFHFLYHP